MEAPSTAREAERSVRRSDTVAWAVRGGLIGYGVMHLLVAWVAVRLVLTPGRGAATGRGALAQLAGEAFGRVALAALAVGFAALVLWQLAAAAVGYHQRSTGRRVIERLGALARAAIWAYLAVMATEVALAGGSGKSPSTATAAVMSWPAGAWLVALVGLVVVAVGVGQAIFGWRVGFLDQLDQRARSREERRVPIVVLGQVGYLTKGVALVVIGTLLVWAAWTHDPHKSGGLDRSLQELLGRGLGRAAVVLVAGGLACFGLFLLARVRHLNRDSLTS